MCLGCWDDEGRPFLLTDAVRQWTPRFREADNYGPLHIIVDDWNLDDDNIEFCRGQKPSTDESALLDALASMSKEERWATAILADYPDFDTSAAHR